MGFFEYFGGVQVQFAFALVAMDINTRTESEFGAVAKNFHSSCFRAAVVQVAEVVVAPAKKHAHFIINIVIA